MSEFVFNDIYGNESARDRYQTHKEFTYFSTVLRLHNKYYEDNNMHHYIFDARKTHSRLSPLKPVSSPHKNNFSYYSVEKINNMTFRINKKNKAQAKKNIETIDINALHNVSIEQRSRSPRDIMKDAKILKTALSEKKDRLKIMNKQSIINRNNKLSLSSVNREIKNLSLGKSIY